MSTAPSSPSPEQDSLHDLAAAVIAGGEVEELMELLMGAALAQTGAASAAIAMPLGGEGWILELAAGEEADALLGMSIPPASALGRALEAQDRRLTAAVGRLELDGLERVALCDLVDAGDAGHGAVLVLRSPGSADPFSGEDRARLEALGIMLSVALRGQRSDAERELQDERTRIARDLHDLAIQELFAVGMQLESLSAALAAPGDPMSDGQIRRTVEGGIQGVERAVAQIRQVVQSLRRDRPEATLSERLRHEVGMATAGLGFAPALRLPGDPAAMDAEIPDEIAEDVVAVVRESLANAARHAHASAVAVAVTLISEGVDRVVQVSVSDNGRGIDPAVSRRSGLANMASRARRHQGWVDAISLEPGTMISWRVTLPPREA